jgi:hypothetical protein
MVRKKAKSIDTQLFNVANQFSPKHYIVKKNSWSEIPLNTGSLKERKKSSLTEIMMIDNPLFKKNNKVDTKINKDTKNKEGYKKYNLKKVFLDLITTKFDKELEIKATNMRNATKKLLSMLYKKEKEIPYYTNNAVTNLVCLILSNGEKYLTKQKVKYNIHFYLKLAEKAMKENDHQTAIIIRLALDNFNIRRLKFKYNKNDKKITDLLMYRYGAFRDCYQKHVREISDLYDLDEHRRKKISDIKIDDKYLPSPFILHMHLNKNMDKEKRHFHKYLRLGKYPSPFDNGNNPYCLEKISKFKDKYYNLFCTKKESQITNLYKKEIGNLDLAKKLVKNINNEKEISEMLFHLSCNVKNVECNKEYNIKKSRIGFNQTLYLK